MSEIHFVNLTRGLLCCEVTDPHFLRIQSTWCEQKRWGDLLMTLGPDFYYNLAIGSEIVVHDVSEKPRVTRALWQGLPLVRYVCERRWAIPARPVYSRTGMNVTAYADQVYRELPGQVRNYVRYFGKFWAGNPLEVATCHSR